jgi:hypothetical protein
MEMAGKQKTPAKVKDDQVSATVEMALQIPRGLIAFLENLQKVGGPEPKTHLEELMTKELQCMIDDLPDDVFDLNFIQERYGEGSNIYKPDAR